MTLIAAFNSPGVGIILADSQETAEDENGHKWKHSVLKIKPEKTGQFSFVIAGSGNGYAIDSFIENFKRALCHSSAADLDGFQELFESKLSSERMRLKGEGDDPTMHFIVSAQVNETFKLWETKTSTLVAIDEGAPCLIGFSAQQYQHIAKALYSSDLRASQRILVGLRILEIARKSATCVDLPYPGIIIGKHGMIPLDDKLLGEMTESLTIFAASLDRLLLSCADTAEESDKFIEHLRKFEETAIQLRKDYLHTVGKINAERWMTNDGAGYGIQLTPAGTVTSFRVGQSGGIEIEVEEAPSEARQMLRAQSRGWPFVLAKLMEYQSISVFCANSQCRQPFTSDTVEPRESQFAPFIIDEMDEEKRKDLLATYDSIEAFKKTKHWVDAVYLKCPQCEEIHPYGFDQIGETEAD